MFYNLGAKLMPMTCIFEPACQIELQVKACLFVPIKKTKIPPKIRHPTSPDHLTHVMRKLAFCICENKDADQLRGNREADQRLCFCYMDSTIFLLSKSKISSF